MLEALAFAYAKLQLTFLIHAKQATTQLCSYYSCSATCLCFIESAMAAVLSMLGYRPATPSETTPHQERRRLQKKSQAQKSKESFYSCKEIFDVVRAQSCLTIFSTESDDDLTSTPDHESPENKQGWGTPPPPPPTVNVLDNEPEKLSEDSISVYSSEEMDPRSQQRRRAKTPVFAIGQLEGKTLGARPVDKAQTLAAQYQAELPSRSITPYVEGDLPKLTRKTLRKIKCQMSLRDLVKDHSERPLSTLSSDADTLVGSASPTSQLSPTKEEFSHDEIALSDTYQSSLSMGDETDCSRSALDHNIGLKICVDLLTNELATALFLQHPAESEDRASGLQILLLIEAFEGIQRQARQRRHNSHVTEQIADHYVEEVESILHHWLEVLYSVYDQSQEKRNSSISTKEHRLNHNSIDNVSVVPTGNG